MLTMADDYPVHQRPEPIARPGSNRDFYDRYFFNGCAPEGQQFFALALGVYPNRNVMDASFCVIHDGIQHNLRASRRCTGERMDVRVGPISIEVLEPLRSLRILVDDDESGSSRGSRGAPLHTRARTRSPHGLHASYTKRRLQGDRGGEGRPSGCHA